jgi:sugar lactone lactonase YvrE
VRPGIAPIFAVAVFAACPGSGSDSSRKDSIAATQADSARPIASVSGFNQPEAVRYDPDQDLYFVGNWGQGGPGAIDNNGFISRVSPDGKVEQLKFIAGGTGGAMLNAPRGMIIVGDTLWVVDADAVRGFNRRTGAPLATANFSAFKLGFLNDIASGPDGLYVTDTGTESIYRISGGTVTVALHDAALGGPNGITWDANGRRFIVVPYNGGSMISAWTPGSSTLTVIGKSGGSSFDGVEVLGDDSVLVATQSDSSLYLFTGGRGHPVIRTGGAPADIAVDTKRHRVAAPFVSRSVVEIWALP